MVGWHHQLNGDVFVCTPGIGDGQGGLACCQGLKQSETTERLKCTETGWRSLLSKGLSRVFSNTTVPEQQFFGVQPSPWSNFTSVHSFEYMDLGWQSDVSVF